MMGINGYGNNLYLDNVMLVAEAQQDLRIVRMLTPSPVICTSPSDINFVLKNQGSISLIEFTVDYSVNGGAVTTLAYSDTDIIPGQSITVTIPGVDFSDGLNNLSITVHPPSGQTDVNPANNSIDINLIVNNSTDLIPLRQTFESSFIGSWPIVNPNGGAVWETINTNYGRSVYFNASSDSDVTDKAWLVSPILDFTISTEASLFFDVSYDGIVIDRLKVMASTDCGQTFINIPFNASSVSTLGNVPAGVNDWANAYVNLTSFAGYPEVRVAFVFTNDHGKDLFLDNIEFFIAANPNPLRITKPYAIYNSALGEDSDFKITFNLPTRQTVDVAVVDMMGRIVFHSQASDILNQTFPIQLESSAGVYIVKLGIGGTSYGTRVLVRR